MTDTAVLTLSEFLLARIAEDEQRARDFEEHYARARNGEYGRGGSEWNAPTWHGAESIGFLPARVLAECEAKRQVVEDFTEGGNSEEEDNMLRWVVKVLAGVYSDHPDYRDEWQRP
jgi:hypothetical protein